MDDFIQWKKNQDSPVYFVVNPLAQSLPHETFYHLGNGDVSAIPLLNNSAYSDAYQQGPWLLPDSKKPDWYQWWNENQQHGEGFAFTSDAPLDDLVSHWQNLFVARYADENIFFRFYDSRVLAPMLATFDAVHLARFLGPAEALIIAAPGDDDDRQGSDTQWRSLSQPDKRARFETAEMPWFSLLPEHMATLSDTPTALFIRNLQRWLWQNRRGRMVQLDARGVDITAGLEQGYRLAHDNRIEPLCIAAYCASHLLDNVKDWPANLPGRWQQLSADTLLKRIIPL